MTAALAVRSPPWAHRGTDRGAVTVEAALAVSSLVVVLALMLSGIGAVIDQLRCTDAATAAARLLARGDTERAHAAIAQIAPQGARLSVHPEGGSVTAEVTADPVGGVLPGVQLHATAFAVLEPGVGGVT